VRVVAVACSHRCSHKTRQRFVQRALGVPARLPEVDIDVFILMLALLIVIVFVEQSPGRGRRAMIVVMVVFVAVGMRRRNAVLRLESLQRDAEESTRSGPAQADRTGPGFDETVLEPAEDTLFVVIVLVVV